jgi:hypothetical protein
MTEPAPGASGEALAEPAHLGSCVSCPEPLGVRPGIEGGGGGGESACECPVGHDERVVAPAVQTNRHAGQLSPHGEHVVSGKVLAVIEGAVSGVAGRLPQCGAGASHAGYPAGPKLVARCGLRRRASRRRRRSREGRPRAAGAPRRSLGGQVGPDATAPLGRARTWRRRCLPACRPPLACPRRSRRRPATARRRLRPIPPGLITVLMAETNPSPPSRHGRGHEVAEELLLVDDETVDYKTTGCEPRTHATAVALQELGPLSRANSPSRRSFVRAEGSRDVIRVGTHTANAVTGRGRLRHTRW